MSEEWPICPEFLDWPGDGELEPEFIGIEDDGSDLPDSELAREDSPRNNPSETRAFIVEDDLQEGHPTPPSDPHSTDRALLHDEAPKDDTEAASRFLREFFEGTHHEVELRALPSKAQCFTRLPKEIRVFIERHTRDNIYFGATTREGRRGDKAACREVVALWVDLDFKSTSEDEARKRLESFPCQPSLIIKSGGGWHIYWLLIEPTCADPARLEPYLHALAENLGGDKAPAEIARVMRLPGTLNWKYDPPRRCQIFRENWDHRYRLEDFSFLLDLKEPKTSRTARAASSGCLPPAVSEGERNSTAARLTGSYLGPHGLNEAETLAILRAWNQTNDAPLPDDELVTTVSSVARTDKRNKPSFEVLSPEEMLTLARVPEEWIVDKILPADASGFITGEPKVGKSWLALYLLWCISLGRPVFEHFEVLKRQRVVLLAEEDHRKRVARRFEKISKGYGEMPDGEWFKLIPRQGFKIDNPSHRSWLKDFLKDFGAGILCIDVFNRVHSAKEKDQDAMSAVVGCIDEVRDVTHCQVLVVHHFRKSGVGEDNMLNQRIRGSSVLAAWLEVCYHLQGGRKGPIKVELEMKDAEPPEPFSFKRADTEKGGIRLDLESGQTEVDDGFKAVCGQPFTASQVVQKLKVSETTARRRISEWLEKGWIVEVESRARGEKVYMACSEAAS